MNREAEGAVRATNLSLRQVCPPQRSGDQHRTKENLARIRLGKQLGEVRTGAVAAAAIRQTQTRREPQVVDGAVNGDSDSHDHYD